MIVLGYDGSLKGEVEEKGDHVRVYPKHNKAFIVNGVYWSTVELYMKAEWAPSPPALFPINSLSIDS